MAFVSPTSYNAFYSKPLQKCAIRTYATPVSVTPVSVRRSCLRMQGPSRTFKADTSKKVFLERLKPLGRVRIITRNEAAIMEAIATFDGLFYAKIPSGEYANVVDMSINLDMHLNLAMFSGCRFEIGVSRSASRAPSYILRLLGKDRESVAMSVFLQWDKDPSDIEPERIDAWNKLKADYTSEGSDTVFLDDES